MIRLNIPLIVFSELTDAELALNRMNDNKHFGKNYIKISSYLILLIVIINE